MADGDVLLTPIGRDFAATTILCSKDLFRQQALGRISVMSSIPIEEAERQLATAVDWGRYGELFEYDAGEGRLSLPS